MNIISKLPLCLFICICCPLTAQSIDWPVWPDSTIHEIGSSFGQYFAGSFKYYHPGIDIMAPAGTPVYAVKSGYVKAVLTTVPDNQYYWRILIGDSAGSQECDAWMYAHLNDYTIAVSEGEWVEEGQYLADLIDYPPNTFPEHLHFVQIRHSGDSWHDAENWQWKTNALDVLDGIADNDTPVFETVYGSQMIGFCRNQSQTYFDGSDTLSGDIDLVCHVYDRINCSTSKVVPYRVEYKLESDTMVDWINGVCFTGQFDYPSADVKIVYRDDATCDSEGDWVNQEYYFCVSNSDGDSLIEYHDRYECWHTADFHNGAVTVSIRAFYRFGNGDSISAVVNIENYHTLTGTISLSNSPPNLGGSVVTVLSSGQAATTAINGSFEIPDIGGGSQQIIITRYAYESVDTVVIMNQDRVIEKTLTRLFYCGDANNDESLSVADAVYLISYVFKGGSAPDPIEAGDANCDGNVNVADAVYMISYVFKGGSEPCAHCW
jgi:hypothetical protein